MAHFAALILLRVTLLNFKSTPNKRTDFFEYERAGEAVYPAKGDQVLLGVDLRVASFEHGNAFTMEKTFALEEPMVDESLDEAALDKVKQELELDYDKLPPIEHN